MPSELVALNADVVGYSALIADDLASMTDTMRVFHELVEREVSSRNGTLANFVSDQLRGAGSYPSHRDDADEEHPRKRGGARVHRPPDLPSSRLGTSRGSLDLEYPTTRALQ